MDTEELNYILSLRGTEEDRIARRKKFDEEMKERIKKQEEEMMELYNNSPFKKVLTFEQFEVMEIFSKFKIPL